VQEITTNKWCRLGGLLDTIETNASGSEAVMASTAA